MNRAVGLILIGIGIGLLVLGTHASDSISSGASRFFTGQPTHKTIWLLLGGATAIVCGGILALLPARKN
jgi:hypothetical protein